MGSRRVRAQSSTQLNCNAPKGLLLLLLLLQLRDSLLLEQVADQPDLHQRDCLAIPVLLAQNLPTCRVQAE